MQQSKGFTLIELMIVIAIVAIIAAIAIPAYGEQVRKSRRAEASRFVGDMQLSLERWRAENPSYAVCSNSVRLGSVPGGAHGYRIAVLRAPNCRGEHDARKLPDHRHATNRQRAG